MSALQHALAEFAGRRIVVVGEAMLDSYLEGQAAKLSREAPVPVVSVQRRVDAPGGAANAAVNARALGAEVDFISVVGDDEEAARLRTALQDRGVSDAHVLTEPGRQSLAKQRVVAAHQILVRFDTGTTAPPGVDAEDALIDELLEVVRGADGILVSDYAYGVVGERVIAALVEHQRQARRAGEDAPPIVVDARDAARHARLEPAATKPNYAEAARLLGEHELDSAEARARQIAAGRDRLLERTGARVVAVTLDQGGALILERDGPGYRTYARPRGEELANGAGDTYSAALVLALASGASVPVAAELAAAAAAVVVGTTGTAVCSASDLRQAVGTSAKRIEHVDRLRERVAYLRSQGRRIIFTNGCFDVLHRGHVSYLVRAKALGDVLVVGVNGDGSVRTLKGPTRPINELDDRLGVLEALSCVDYVIAFDALRPDELIRAVRPDVFVKGGDYREESLPEAALVTELGGSVRILPYVDDHSTTGLIARMRSAAESAAEAPAR